MLINKLNHIVLLILGTTLIGCSSQNAQFENENLTTTSSNQIAMVSSSLNLSTSNEKVLNSKKINKALINHYQKMLPNDLYVYIDSLNESDNIKESLFKFALNVKNAINLGLDENNNIKGPIMYNIMQSSYDVMLKKGQASGRKLLDEISLRLCDTSDKNMRYQLFLQSFNPTQVYASNLR